MAGGQGNDRGWVGCMASLSQWTWVWVNSRSRWWTGRPGMLQSMGLPRGGHDWATKLNWTEVRNKPWFPLLLPQENINGWTFGEGLKEVIVKWFLSELGLTVSHSIWKDISHTITNNMFLSTYILYTNNSFRLLKKIVSSCIIQIFFILTDSEWWFIQVASLVVSSLDSATKNYVRV